MYGKTESLKNKLEIIKYMFQSQFWVRFKKNKLAIAGGIFIVIACFIAFCGYAISVDKTPFSNDQNLAIAAKPPMFRVKVAYVSKNKISVENNFIQKIIYGTENSFTTIPIQSYTIKNDSILLLEYVSNSDEIANTTKYHLVDVAFALNAYKPITKTTNGNYCFTDIHNSKIEISKNELIKIIVDKNISTKTFVLGTDRFGRDFFSRLLIGTRISISVGFISVFISLIIGILLGVIAGYYRGFTDTVVSWFINVVWSVPTLLMVLSITLVLGKGFWQIFIAVGLTMWVEIARVVRGQVLGIREKEYIEAARALGYNDFRIIFKHILPNIIGPVVIISAANFASAILMEAGLSFLGIGVQPPIPSWGNIIKDHYMYIILDQAWLALLPGLAIMLMVLAFNFVGDGLRDGFDTKME